MGIAYQINQMQLNLHTDYIILSICRQKQMRLIFKVWIMSFSFLERLEHHAEKHNQNEFVLRHCKVRDAD